MHNHAPENYDCPFCRLACGLNTSASTQHDVVYRDDAVTAFLSAGWWPNNPGHVLVAPNMHYENIFDLPPELGTPIQRVAREIAVAFKETYGCDGVSSRQHNEPAGDQDVWHYHLHVFPRYVDDHLYLHRRRPSTPQERHPYAVKLREFLSTSRS
jgi:histidine triad (HIT) family protein